MAILDIYLWKKKDATVESIRSWNYAALFQDRFHDDTANQLNQSQFGMPVDKIILEKNIPPSWTWKNNILTKLCWTKTILKKNKYINYIPAQKKVMSNIDEYAMETITSMEQQAEVKIVHSSCRYSFGIM